MKKISLLLFPILMIGIADPAFSLAGIGVYGLTEPISVAAGRDGDPPISLVRDGFDGALGGGLFLYIDALPFIDLEASVETALNTYQFTFKNAISELPAVDFGWARVSTYLTLRKKVFGLGLPVLGGLKLHVGGGINKHASTPLADLDMVKSYLNQDLTSSFQADDMEDWLVDYLKENKIDASGLHFQAGAQLKLLALNLFINYRITRAEDVIPGEDGFSSLWLGLALGL